MFLRAYVDHRLSGKVILYYYIGTFLKYQTVIFQFVITILLQFRCLVPLFCPLCLFYEVQAHFAFEDANQ